MGATVFKSWEKLQHPRVQGFSSTMGRGALSLLQRSCQWPLWYVLKGLEKYGVDPLGFSSDILKKESFIYSLDARGRRYYKFKITISTSFIS